MSAARLQPETTRLAPTAIIHPSATIGDGVSIWDLAQVREAADIGKDTVIGRYVYVDHHVRIGVNCEVQNHALVYRLAEWEETARLEGVSEGDAPVKPFASPSRSILSSRGSDSGGSEMLFSGCPGR